MTMVMLTLMMLTNWAASGDIINGDDNFDVDKGY